MSLLFTSDIVAGEKRLDLGTFKWAQVLKEAGVEKVNLCGTAEIQNSVQSLKHDFFSRKSKKGYLFSGLISNDDYWRILKTHNLNTSKEELKKLFSKTILWEISWTGEVRNLGNPIEVQTAFTATVKDCVDGAKTTLGMSCSNYKPEHRESCCSEKFVGPKVVWKASKGSFVLTYSPDPSIQLKIPGELTNRFCHSIESVTF